MNIAKWFINAVWWRPKGMDGLTDADVRKFFRENFKDCLHTVRGKLDVAELTAGQWPKLWFKFNGHSVGLLDDVALYGNTLFVGHFSVVEARLAKRGFGRAITDGLRSFVHKLGVEKIIFSVRTEGQGQEEFFSAIGARQLVSEKGLLVPTFCCDINAHHEEKLRARVADLASALENILVYEQMLVAVLQYSGNSRVIDDAVNALKLQRQRLQGTLGFELNAEMDRINKAIGILPQFERCLNARWKPSIL